MTQEYPFRPFEDNLDKAECLSDLQQHIQGGDDGEIFFERMKSESLVFDDKRLKSANFSSHEGYGLRMVNGPTIGYAHSNEITRESLKRAAETARLAVRDGGGTLKLAPVLTNRKRYPDINPVNENSFTEKVELLESIDTYAREQDPLVVQASASITTVSQEIEILRPDGFNVCDMRPMCRIGISVILDKDGHRETGYVGQGGRHSPSALMQPKSWKTLVDEALRIAHVNLEAEPAPAGVMDVVLGPGWPGILLHEAIGHGLEGDFNRKGTSAFAGLMGSRIASPGVTVLDDGTLQNKRGSITFDDEGTPSQTTTLIEDGILTGYMQDRQNGRMMGSQSTGNGRRQSFAHSPMPRMTNTYMLASDANPEDIVATLKDGIHAVGFGGGQVDITNGKFVFSCTEAYRIKNGKRVSPVKNATLIGDGPTVLKNIRAIGNDMQIDPGVGNCGKNGQWVPVCVGLPTILIGGLTVGGSIA